MLSKIINDEMKDLIREKKYTKNEIMRKIYDKYGNIGNITFGMIAVIIVYVRN